MSVKRVYLGGFHMSKYVNLHHNIRDYLNTSNKSNQIFLALFRSISALIDNSFVLNSWIHNMLPTAPRFAKSKYKIFLTIISLMYYII